VCTILAPIKLKKPNFRCRRRYTKSFFLPQMKIIIKVSAMLLLGRPRRMK
jgi:hypothetical protein